MPLHYSPQNNFRTLPGDGIGDGGNEIPIVSTEIFATSIKIKFFPVGDGWTYRALIYDVDGTLLYTGTAYDIPQDIDTAAELDMIGLAPNTSLRYRIEACDAGEFAP